MTHPTIKEALQVTTDVLIPEIERLRAQNKAQLAELHAISEALGTNEGHSSVHWIEQLIKDRDIWRQKAIELGLDASNLQARLDALMLEHCPKEMTPEQMANWAKHQQPYDLNKCPNCGGPADNGHDRCYPPNPYYCTKCEDQP